MQDFEDIKNPLVSVIMTCYNREVYITEAIESVLASKYKNFELLVVDDHSGDNTVNIVKQFLQDEKRIRLIENDKNLGDYPNRNNGIQYAQGEYIFFVDSDDEMFPATIEKVIDFLVSHPEINFGIGSVGKSAFDHPPQILSSKDVIKRNFFEYPILAIGPGGTVVKKEFHNLLSNYPTIYGPANDMYFNLAAAIKSAVAVFPFEFVKYRRHDGQEINNQYSYLYNNYRYLNDALTQLQMPLTSKQKKWIALKNKRRFTVNITKYLLKTRDIKKTRNAIKLAGFKLTDALQGIFH